MTPKKLLVADDEPNIVISLEYLMKREGYDVLVATDGNQALEAIQREQPALVLLDVMMPGKTGFEVCQAVRADPALASIPVLMVTAEAKREQIIAAAQAGVNGYVVKPFTAAVLKEKIDKIFERIEG